MAEKRACATCGQSFERPKGSRKRYCDRKACKRRRARARQRSHRAPSNVVQLPTAVAPKAEAEVEVRSVASAVAAELEELLRLDTSDGRLALALARRIDEAADDSGSSVAQVAKELRAQMDVIRKGAPRQDDELDKLRARRARRGA